MQFFKYNRTAAIAALVLIVLISVPLGVRRSVFSLAGRVESTYADTAARSDLEKYVAHAESFAAAYEAVFERDPALRAAIDALRDTLDSPFEMTDEQDTLSSLAASAYYKASLLSAEGTESLKNSMIAYYYEMQSDEMRLGNNAEYARQAEAYNRAIRAFPASVFCPQRTPAVTFG